MLAKSGLSEVKIVGGKFTWTGKRFNHSVKTRIDRVCATADWLDLFPAAYAQLLNWTGSDHRPILLCTDNKVWKGKASFRYDNRWRSNSEVKEVIKLTWERECQQIAGENMVEALRKCRSELSRWKSNNITNALKKINDLQQLPHQAYAFHPLNFDYIHHLKSELSQEYRLEEEFWRTKSRIHWLQAGDRNTKFFHAKTKQSLEVTEFINCIQTKVTSEMNDALTRSLTEAEITHALNQMSRDKSPGPDGFTAGFFKDHWPTLKQEKWRSWINLCISTVTYSILVNGAPIGKIYPKRSIRQGKDVLLKSVATTIPSYCMSCFQLPIKIHNQLNVTIRQTNKIPWIAWRKVTQPKTRGEIGIRDMKVFNVALVAKQTWRLLQKPSSLLARVYKNKYYPNGNVLEAAAKPRSSHAWKSIIQGTYQWGEEALTRHVRPEDIPIIKKIRPSLTGNDIQANSLVHNIALLLDRVQMKSHQTCIPLFIGWQLWKTRNELIFSNRRTPLPDVISRALLSFQLWKEALEADNHHTSQQTNNETANVSHLDRSSWPEGNLQANVDYYCYVDGSWMSENHFIGVG